MINREIQEDLEDFIHFRGMKLPGLTRLVCDERRSPVDISRAEIALTLEYGVPVISAVGHSGKPNLSNFGLSMPTLLACLVNSKSGDLKLLELLQFSQSSYRIINPI